MGDTDKAKIGLLRFARLAANQQRRKLKSLEENRTEESSQSDHWLSGHAKLKHDANQYAYTEEYVAEYRVPININPNRDDTNYRPGEQQANEFGAEEEGDPDQRVLNQSRGLRRNYSQPDSIDDDQSEVASNADTLVSLNQSVGSEHTGRGLRGRGLLIKACQSRAGSSIFEAPSTVMVPSSVNMPEEYTSNVNVDELRKSYFSNYKINKSLPIFKNKAEILNSINSYSVVIIQGMTGCGKTTQVPTYILEDAILTNRMSKAPVIYVTQPRRIAARSIAERVCDEHNWTMGSIVGYQVGLEKHVNEKTILVFCTSGVLLQKLIQEKSLNNYTHIIIDEAHERDADTDLLMMMIRTLMRKEQSFFRLIVMSATIDVSKLKAYFTFKTSYGHMPMITPSVCKIGSSDIQPSNVQMIYLDRFKAAININCPIPPLDLNQPQIFEDCLQAAAKIILKVIPTLETFNETSKSTLVFLPGLAEITRLHKLLRNTEQLIDIIPLHSCLSTKDQVRVFEPCMKGYRKVILATNIAESSITVKDAGFIIDFCLTKSLRKDEVTRFPTLNLQWCSMDKCIQRAGRTGRCCDGKVFRMVTHDFYKQFDSFAEPELLTAPLELSVLRIKNFQMGQIKALLAVVLDPPPLREIETAVLELKQIGALSCSYEGKLSNIDGDLTELGKVISALPIDVHLSKLIVLAHLFDVLEDAIIVAACLSTNRTVVKHIYGNILESFSSKLEWAKGSYSDLFVSIEVYKDYVYYKSVQQKNARWLETYCDQRLLDEKKLFEVSILVQELTTRLENVNIKKFDQPNRAARDQCKDELMLKVAFCAAFYPNYFLTERLNVADVERDLQGFDPRKTCILGNFPINQVDLYRGQVLDQVSARVTNRVDFISDCSRALLVVNEPDGDEHAREVRRLESVLGDHIIEPTTPLTKSLYMMLKIDDSDRLIIREYTYDSASDRMKYYKQRREEIKQSAPNRLMPSLTRLVVGRDADNSLLTTNDEESYEEFIKGAYCMEIEANEAQELEDAPHLDDPEIVNSEPDASNNDTKDNKQNAAPTNGHPANINGQPATNGMAHADSQATGSGQQLAVPKASVPEIKYTFAGYRQLRGPDSPIRMRFRSVLEKSKGYNVDMDPLSVNSVLLDADYARGRRQMLVAAAVSQSQRRNRVIARDTTLMPNIRGLPSIMALLFAQYYRFIYNDRMACLAGAIFGIGWEDDDNPLDKNYQVEIGFDVQITDTDLQLIDRARRAISELLRFVDIQNPGSPQSVLQEQLRDIIMALIKRRRFPIQEAPVSKIDLKAPEQTNAANYDEQDGCGFSVEPAETVMSAERNSKLSSGQTREFLPTMRASKIFDEQDTREALRLNLQLLGAIERCERSLPIGGVRCLLCGSGVEHLLILHNQLVTHLRSEEHLVNLRTSNIEL